MEIKLLHVAPLSLLVSGIRKCWDSGDKSDSYYTNEESPTHEMTFHLGDRDKKLINQIIKCGHLSTFEHINFTFDIEGFSRDVLQEFSRHRVGTSPSVKSTRYTLAELKTEESFVVKSIREDGNMQVDVDWDRVQNYCVLTGITRIDEAIVDALENARILKSNDFPNDRVKYCLPGAYKTSGQYTFNARALRNLFYLRTDPKALWEFRELGYMLFGKIPSEYKFLFEDCVYKEDKQQDPMQLELDLPYGSIVDGVFVPEKP